MIFRHIFKSFIHIHNIPQLSILYQPNFVRVALRLDRHIRDFLHIPSHSFTISIQFWYWTERNHRFWRQKMHCGIVTTGKRSQPSQPDVPNRLLSRANAFFRWRTCCAPDSWSDSKQGTNDWGKSVSMEKTWTKSEKIKEFAYSQ